MNLVQLKQFLLIFFLLFSTTRSAKILGFFGMPSFSHYTLGSTLMKGLAEKGHDVTVISVFGESKLPQMKGSYRDVLLTGSLEKFNERRKDVGADMYSYMHNQNMFSRLLFMHSAFPRVNENALKHPKMQQLLKSNETFDVVIVEQFFNDAIKALAHHFNASLILFSPSPANIQLNPLVGNPAPPSYIPNIMLGYTSKMTFSQRAYNSFVNLVYDLYNYFVLLPLQKRMAKNYFPNPPDLKDVIYNASLVLLNSHPSFTQSVPKVPNMIEIGGFHIKPPKKLPEDLQQFLDSAKDGAIYFSMGSNLVTSSLPPEKRDALLKSFAKLKQKVLWKWEDDDKELPGQPPNVKLGKWFPQRDILAHPNIKLFITHCGFLSSTETVYFGVPVLAIPVFGDQRANAATTVANGYGLSLPYSELTEDKLTRLINELLNNPKYRENVQQRSKIMHDRPMNPLDTAIYWVEYVIRHKGASHLRVAALDLSWYQYLLMDVIAFGISVILALFSVFYFIIKKCCKAWRKDKAKKKVKKN